MPAEHTLSMTTNTFAHRREDIFKRLQHCVEVCKLNYGGKSELATEKDELVVDLCDALEDLFSYGLRQQNLNVVAAAASLLQNMHEIVTGGNNSMMTINNNDITFWDFCQMHLIQHEYERYMDLKQIWTKNGLGRAFLRATLNENSLHRYVLTWLGTPSVLQKFYTPWSLLLNEEVAKQLPEVINNLKDVLFALNVDNVELNAPRRISTTTAAKEEPIINAPDPVPVVAASTNQNRKNYAIERPILGTSPSDDLWLSPKLQETTSVPENNMEVYVNTAEPYSTPVDPIEPELEFLKTPLPEISVSANNEQDHEAHEERSDTDTSSQYSKSSNGCATSYQAVLEDKVSDLSDRCFLLETRVAELSLLNRQLVRRLTVQFNQTGIDPTSSLCANFLITIPQVKLINKPHSAGSYYTYEIHITMRQRLEHWSIYRRYREFYKLHKCLQRTHPVISAVQFPPKKHFGNMNLLFVEERRQQLQIYLLNLVEILPQVEACKTKTDLQKAFPFFREA